MFPIQFSRGHVAALTMWGENIPVERFNEMQRGASKGTQRCSEVQIQTGKKTTLLKSWIIYEVQGLCAR